MRHNELAQPLTVRFYTRDVLGLNLGDEVHDQSTLKPDGEKEKSEGKHRERMYLTWGGGRFSAYEGFHAVPALPSGKMCCKESKIFRVARMSEKKWTVL
jgi:hypothetical protein